MASKAQQIQKAKEDLAGAQAVAAAVGGGAAAQAEVDKAAATLSDLVGVKGRATGAGR